MITTAPRKCQCRQLRGFALLTYTTANSSRSLDTPLQRQQS